MDQEDFDELEESMRSLTALLKSGQAGFSYHVDGDERLEYETGTDHLPVVPNGYEDEEDDEEDELANDSSDPSDLPPIATLPHDNPSENAQNAISSGLVITSVPLQIEGVAEDLFPIPLRTRKGKNGVTALAKRKR
jgi:hypothetical protein